MEKEYPKRLMEAGNEPQVEKINNTCRMSFLSIIKAALPAEYETVKSDAVFSQVFAIFENGLKYSGRLIHNIMCRQLVTRKRHELWFVFGKKPLRFSMQEFYAVTGLKYKDDFIGDSEKWTDDKGFWSKVLKRGDKISIQKLLKVHLPGVPSWGKEDRIKFVYVCVIAGLVMAKEEEQHIPHLYIRLVMDLDKVRTYPWGLHSFDHLLSSIEKVRSKLRKTSSYCLDGFSYALQIWVMEAIPVVGDLLGKKISTELTGAPRCCNWKGAVKISYDDISLIEGSIKAKDLVYPYISSTGNCDVFESIEFFRPDEVKDLEVENLMHSIATGYDFADHIWCSVAPNDENDVEDKDVVGEDIDHPHDDIGVTSLSDHDPMSGLENVEKSTKDEKAAGLRKRKKKQADFGAETRKINLLFERASTSQCSMNEEMKSFIKGMFETSFTSFKESIDKRLEKIEGDVLEIKESIVTFGVTKPPTQEPKASPSKDTKGKRNSLDDTECFEDLFNQTQIDLNLDTQEFLEKAVGHLSQKTEVPEFDYKQSLRGSNVKDMGENDPDAVLVFVAEATWDAFFEWYNLKEVSSCFRW